MAKENLGKVMMIVKGEYSNDITYEILDIVYYNGSSYVCKKDSVGNTPENLEYWQLIAEKGSKPILGVDYFTEEDKKEITNYVANALSNNKETVTGENITVNDSAEERIYEFNISGNSKQEGEPTPDTPIEVKSCGDNITNIFNKNTGIITGQYIGSDGSISTDTNLFYQDVYIKVEALKQYTISSNITTIYRIAEYDVNKTFIQRYLNGREQTSWTFTVSNNCKYIKIAGTLIESLDSLQIEKSSTPTAYTAYGQGSINEIICNKNLFDKNNDGIVKNKLITPEGILENSTIGSVSNFVNCKENKNLIIYRGAYEGYTNRIVFFDENKNMLSSIESTGETYTFTTPQNTKYLRFQFPTSNIDKIQLEEGAVATEYEEHKEQVYTIPTQQPMKNGDTFVKVNGKWHERHKVGRLTLNGTENWQKINGYGIFYINDINNLKPNTSDNVLTGYISTHFKEIITNDINAKTEGFCVATINRLYFFHNGYSNDENLEGFKTWLQEQNNAGTPVYVDYVLATPNDIKCTEEQTVILDEIKFTAKTYKGTTHFYSTDDIGSNKEIRYIKILK